MDQKNIGSSTESQRIKKEITYTNTNLYQTYIQDKGDIDSLTEGRQIKSENTYINTNFYQNYLPVEPNAAVYPTISMNYIQNANVDQPLQLPPIITSTPGHIPEHFTQYYQATNLPPTNYSPISSDFTHDITQAWMDQSQECYPTNCQPDNVGWVMTPINLNTNYNSVQRVPPRRMSISFPHHFPIIQSPINQRYCEVTNPSYGSRPDLSPFKPLPGRPAQNHTGKRRVNSAQSSLNKELVDQPVTAMERSISLSDKNDPHLQQKKQFPCTYPGCIKIFKRSEHLKRHLSTVHTDIKPYVCTYPECEKKFSRSDNLSQHIKTHKNRKMSATF